MANIKPFIAVVSLLCFAVAAGAGDGYLISVDGAVHSEEGTLKTLGEFEYAYVSPGGAYYVVLSFVEGAFPIKSTARIYDKTGRLSYAVPNTGASAAVVADNGACVLVTMSADGPEATADLDFYDSSGVNVGSAAVGYPGDAMFSPSADYAAVISAGEATYVFDADDGDLLYELPASRTLAADDNGSVLLVDPEFIALYRDGFAEWSFGHDLYYPRMAQVNEGNTAALVGCHHEVALVDMESGRITETWEAPDGFAVTDIDASDDFSIIGVGVRSLDGVEAAYLLDDSFGVLKSKTETVAKPSGAMPIVIVVDGVTPEATVFGQGWRATLEK
ncbi:MAG: hypothetical protein JSW52_07940 [Candidatus Coatesbacteria bacterium]|nr:MAG: hypothetical protein JSW52_07940 [Candidatus Coatesbacteria bacterium]